MTKTRKQRAGGKYHPSLPLFKKPSRFGSVLRVPALSMKPGMNKVKSGTYGKKSAQKPAPKSKHTLKTLKIRRNNSTSEYIKSVKALLHKTNETLREPNEEYDIALEISEELKKELKELEESLGVSKPKFNDEMPLEEAVERVIELVNKYSKYPKKIMLIAVTVDGAVTKAKPGAPDAAAAAAGAGENANVGELAAMLGALQPFKTA